MHKIENKFSNKILIKLDKNISLKLDVVDDWLKNVFKIDIEPCQCDTLASLNEKQAYIVQIAWRVLLLRKVLLQAVYVPIFDTGNIVSIDEHNQYFLVTIILKIVNNIPRTIYITIMNFIFATILKQMQEEKNSKSIDSIFKKITNHIMASLIPLSGSGKSTIPILKTAYKMKIPFEHIGGGIYRLGLGSSSKLMFRSSTEFDSVIGVKLSQNKIYTALIIRNLGLPAPEHALVNSYEEALKVSRHISCAVVVKPADLDRGEGVSVDIVNEEQLKDAFENAQKISASKQIIIERQADGVCHRVFIYNGEMLYALKRLPKSLVGNGKNSIEELVVQANTHEIQNPPWKKTEPFAFDNLALKSLEDAGFSLQNIPKKGDIVPLRRIESTKDGGYDIDVTQSIHPDNIDIALRAAKAFHLDVVGVDIISSDITKPWYTNGAIINELNYAPLYGGSEISRATIPLFLERFLPTNGRIPISVVIGNDKAMKKAKQILKNRQKKGIQAYLSTHDKSYKNTSQEIYLTFTNLYQRVQSFLINTDVDELILVVQNSGLLETGLPIDIIDELIVENETIDNFKDVYKLLLSVLVK